MVSGVESAVVARQRLLNSALAEQAVDLAVMDGSREHEALGFSSVVSWARVVLGLHPDETRALVRVGRMLRDLPRVRAAALAGELSWRHLQSFDYALRIVGRDETVEAEGDLLEFARSVPAQDFHAKLRQLREATLDELDAAWRRGMDKADFCLSRTLDGFQVSGFLPIGVGAKFATVLDSASVPRGAGDVRAPSRRRVEALDAMCEAILEHGLPTDNGVRPQLRLVIDVDHDLEQTHATLSNFGQVGPAFVDHLACDADWLTLATRNRHVLDVGRRRRYATPKQTEAILLHQNGTCAGPGCRHPIAHLHHKVPWSHGGHTNLDNLIGYCHKCHTLEHLSRLRHTDTLTRTG